MNSDKNFYVNYWSEAFNLGVSMGDFDSVPINKLGLGVMALVIIFTQSPALFFLTAGAELTYLLGLVNSSRFQNYVKGKLLLEDKTSKLERLNEIASSLKMVHSMRLQKLNTNIADINRLMKWNVEDRRGITTNFLVTSRQESLNQIAVLFLKLLRTKQLIEDSLGKSNTTQIKEQIAKYEGQLKYSNMTQAMERSIRGNLDIYQRRLNNFESIRKNADLVELELQRVENQVTFFKEELAVDTSPEAITNSLNLINDNLMETQNWVNKNGEFLRKLNAPVFSDDSEY